MSPPAESLSFVFFFKGIIILREQFYTNGGINCVIKRDVELKEEKVNCNVLVP